MVTEILTGTTVGLLVLIAGAFLAYLRSMDAKLDDHDRKLTRLIVKVENGITDELQGLAKEVKEMRATQAEVIRKLDR